MVTGLGILTFVQEDYSRRKLDAFFQLSYLLVRSIVTDQAQNDCAIREPLSTPAGSQRSVPGKCPVLPDDQAVQPRLRVHS